MFSKRVLLIFLALFVFFKLYNNTAKNPDSITTADPTTATNPTTTSTLEHSAMSLPKTSLKYIVIDPVGPHTSTFVILHGLGDTGNGWVSFAKLLQRKFPGMKFVLPHAPVIPITAFNNQRVPSWFNIFQLGQSDGKKDVDGFLKSVREVELLLVEEAAKVDAGKLVLGGFSQGAALTLTSAAIDKDVRLGGFVALSGFCPILDDVLKQRQETNLDVPVLQCHGTADTMITYQYAQDTYAFFKNNIGLRDYEFREYAGLGHSTTEKEIADVVDFLTTKVGLK